MRDLRQFDAIVLAVAQDGYPNRVQTGLDVLLKPDGVVAYVESVLDLAALGPNRSYGSLLTKTPCESQAASRQLPSGARVRVTRSPSCRAPRSGALPV